MLQNRSGESFLSIRQLRKQREVVVLSEGPSQLMKLRWVADEALVAEDLAGDSSYEAGCRRISTNWIAEYFDDLPHPFPRIRRHHQLKSMTINDSVRTNTKALTNGCVLVQQVETILRRQGPFDGRGTVRRHLLPLLLLYFIPGYQCDAIGRGRHFRIAFGAVNLGVSKCLFKSTNPFVPTSGCAQQPDESLV